MPRNGAGVYSHPFPNVVEGTTIESAVFNGNTSDVEQDLNTPRPIVAGGTGANNAHDAMIALSGEIAMQIVTNYDTFPFVSGSFYSAAGATSAPTGASFSGICYTTPDTGYMTVEAREVASGQLYVRQKIAGTWGAWRPQAGSTTDLDATYVNVTGDNMSGGLTLAYSDPTFQMVKSTGTGVCQMYIYTGSYLRWLWRLSDSAAESGSNVGADFGLYRCDDAGAIVDAALRINRASGNASFGASLTAGANTTGGSYYFGNSGTKYLQFDGSSYSLFGGALTVRNDLWVIGASDPTVGTLYLGNTGSKYLIAGTNFSFIGGQLYAEGGRVWSNGNIPNNYGVPGYMKLPNGIIMQWGSTITGTSDVNGNVIINVPTAFPNACTMVLAMNGNYGDGAHILMSSLVGSDFPSTGAFAIHFNNSMTGAPLVGLALRVNWIVYGY